MASYNGCLHRKDKIVTEIYKKFDTNIYLNTYEILAHDVRCKNTEKEIKYYRQVIF